MRAEILRQAVACLFDTNMARVRCRYFGRRYEIHLDGCGLSLADSSDSWMDAFAVVVEQAHLRHRAGYLPQPPKEVERWAPNHGVKELIHRGRVRVKECWDLGIEPGMSPTKYLENKERQKRYYQARKAERDLCVKVAVAQAAMGMLEQKTRPTQTEEERELLREANRIARLEAEAARLEKRAKEEQEYLEREERRRKRQEYADAYARAPSDEFVLATGESSLHIRRLLGKARLRGLMGFDGNGNRRIPRAQRLDEYDEDSERWG